MIVLRAAIGFEEIILKIDKPPLNVVLEFRVTGAFHVTHQAIEIVPGVKVIDPVVFGIFAIKPRAIRILSRATVVHRLARELEHGLVPGDFADPCQQRGAEHARIVN